MAATALVPGTKYVLTVSCADRPGLIHAVAGFLVDHDANVIESKQFDDRQTGKFFMRVQFESGRRQPAGCRQAPRGFRRRRGVLRHDLEPHRRRHTASGS